MDHLRQRTLSALVLLPVALACSYLGGWFFWALLLVFGGFALWELSGLYAVPLPDRRASLLLLLAIFLCSSPFFSLPLEGIALLLLFAGSTYFLLAAKGGNRTRIAALFFGLLYIGLPLHWLFLLRQWPDGLYYFLLFLVGTLLCDIVAYFAGHWWGRRRIFPQISPGKTLAGTLAGFFGGVGGVFAVGLLFGTPLLPLLPLGLLISLFSVLGDLFESMLKRDAGIKDSSRAIPGHGGFLDRLDSLLFTAPLVYFYGIFILSL
ncbi:MAG: phosphatidate cytidylyltransferase [Coprothermobacterota bacterium]|nr:phosphatidate cytidylyltransferase [Coprothermobacterota bacterium]